MSEQQSIRDELAATIHENFNACRGRGGVSPDALAQVILASPVIRRIQADAWAVGFNDATDEAHTAHEEYPARHENPYRESGD